MTPCSKIILTKAERESLGQYALRGLVNQQPIRNERSAVQVTWIAKAQRFFDGKVETFKGLEFVERIVARASQAHPFCTRGWLKATESELTVAGTPETGIETVDQSEIPDAWSRLLRKVYGVDLFLCPECGGTMRVVAALDEPEN